MPNKKAKSVPRFLLQSKKKILGEISKIDSYSVDDDNVGGVLKERGRKLEIALDNVQFDIEQRLKGITKGVRYGICRACGKKISRERMEIIPEADMCVPCAEKNNK